MNWCDEKYVKLFTRNTATWCMWPWQARCVLPLLIRASNYAGLVDVGGKDPIQGLAVLMMVPREVVAPALEAMLEDGTVEVVKSGYLIPKYLEAQESTKTARLKKSDQRDRERAKARGIVDVPVTQCHPTSPSVPLHHQPTTTTTTTTSPVAGDKPPAPRKGKKPKPELPPDPRHAPMVKRVVDIFRIHRGSEYPFGGRDAAALRDLLKAADPDVLADAWGRALMHRGFPAISTLSELHRNLAHFVGAGAPIGPPPFDPNNGITRSTGNSYPNNVNVGLAPEVLPDPPAPKREDPFPWRRT